MRFICFLLNIQMLLATVPAGVFQKHPNKYFVETGSYQGDGIQKILDAKFQEIYSVELSPYHHRCCSSRFGSNSNVHLYLGNSISILPEIMEKIDAPATIWLDAHYSSGTTVRGDTNTAILEELDILQKHTIKTHTIIIDNLRLFGQPEFDFIELDEIFSRLLDINPNYQFSFENGHVPGDILIASPLRTKSGI